ncbi:MAG: hypothetical protein IJG82_01685, partial [Atopobiaceae bacterium]|nr:hypothetical protein [Atopobiaceae bacterium]
MEYEGKYAEMAEQLRADGCDEAMVERFVREEMEADAARAGEGIMQLDAYREFRALPEWEQEILRTNAFCANCGMTAIAPGFTVRKVSGLLLLEGKCEQCG